MVRKDEYSSPQDHRGGPGKDPSQTNIVQCLEPHYPPKGDEESGNGACSCTLFTIIFPETWWLLIPISDSFARELFHEIHGSIPYLFFIYFSYFYK